MCGGLEVDHLFYYEKYMFDSNSGDIIIWHDHVVVDKFILLFL